MFHFGTLRIAEVKAALAAAGYPVRGRTAAGSEGPRTMALAWLPYATREADRRLGGIPDGIEVDCYRADGDPMPDSIAEVEFYVLPYMKGAEYSSALTRCPASRSSRP